MPQTTLPGIQVMTTKDEMMRAVGRGASPGTRLIYLALGITRLFFPGWTTVTCMKGVMKGVFGICTLESVASIAGGVEQ